MAAKTLRAPLQIDNLNFQSLEVVSCYRNAHLQNTEVRNYSNFTLFTLSPQYGDVLVIFSRFNWNSKWPLQINFIFFVGAKTRKVRYDLNFTITYGDVQVIFSRFYWNSKWPPLINFIIFVDPESCKLEIMQILQSQSHWYGDVYVISRFYWNSKWSPWTNFMIFCGCEKPQKFRWKIIQILQSHNPPYGNVHVISLKFKIATTSRFFKYLSPQIIYDFRPLVLYRDLK